MLNTRTVEVYENEQWRAGTWAELGKGTIFRLLEEDGTIANPEVAHGIAIAKGKADLTQVPWVVQCNPYDIENSKTLSYP